MANLAQIVEVTAAQWKYIVDSGSTGYVINGVTYKATDADRIYVVEKASGYTQLKANTSISNGSSTSVTVADYSGYDFIVIKTYYNATQNSTMHMIPTKLARSIFSTSGTSSSTPSWSIPICYSTSVVRWMRVMFPSNTSIYIYNSAGYTVYYQIWGYNV